MNCYVSTWDFLILILLIVIIIINHLAIIYIQIVFLQFGWAEADTPECGLHSAGFPGNDVYNDITCIHSLYTIIYNLCYVYCIQWPVYTYLRPVYTGDVGRAEAQTELYVDADQSLADKAPHGLTGAGLPGLLREERGRGGRHNKQGRVVIISISGKGRGHYIFSGGISVFRAFYAFFGPYDSIESKKEGGVKRISL